MNKIKTWYSDTDFSEYFDEVVLFLKYFGIFSVGCIVCYMMYLCAAGVFACLAVAFGAFVYNDWQIARDST